MDKITIWAMVTGIEKDGVYFKHKLYGAFDPAEGLKYPFSEYGEHILVLDRPLQFKQKYRIEVTPEK